MTNWILEDQDMQHIVNLNRVTRIKVEELHDVEQGWGIVMYFESSNIIIKRGPKEEVIETMKATVRRLCEVLSRERGGLYFLEVGSEQR